LFRHASEGWHPGKDIMSIQFTKMHGLGNDFMVIDATHHTVNLTPQQITAWADRHTGIGFDQCLVLAPSKRADADFYYQIFNADGTEAGQCGNGARCIGWFIQAKGLSAKNPVRVHTNKQILDLMRLASGEVQVDLGAPLSGVAPAHILTDGREVLLHTVNVGNPHAVLEVDSIQTAPVDTLGPQLVGHTHFPDGANIGFMEILSPHAINLRVYERGAGETLACGSGACAAAVIGISRGLLHSPVKVRLPGGELEIEWDGIGQAIKMTGPVACVYEGII
jgi:diaminopimelate epimerase